MDPEILRIGIVMGALAFTGTVASSIWALVHYKLKKREIDAQGRDPEWVAEVEGLREELHDTRAQLAEMQERVDFAERMLTAARIPRDS